MKLDFLENINEHNDTIVRLYDFDSNQAKSFENLIKSEIIDNKSELNLSTIEFIDSISCNLILKISTEDIGITTENNYDFVCELTLNGYNEIINLMEPFTTKESTGFQWLYNIDTPIDFLFSPRGKW